jgi:UTP--glucose-1-phosphate uridylyltransferase
LTLRSDCFDLTSDGRVVVSPARRLPGQPFVELDPDHYKLLDDFEARFPAGAPSLVACERLVVRGDVRFGSDVAVRGAVTIDNAGVRDQLRVADGTRLGDDRSA